MNDTEITWTTIDGNRTKSKPVAYCKSHKGYLTVKQMELHKCRKRCCKGLRKLPHEFWDIREERKRLSKTKKLSYVGK